MPLARRAGMWKGETLPGFNGDSKVRYFSAHGCVDYTDASQIRVLVGGDLIGAFAPKERVKRDVLIAMVSSNKGARCNRIAEAFDVCTETVRMVRRTYEQDGIEGLAARHRRGRPRVQTAELEGELFELFDRGVSIPKAHQAIGERVSQTVVSRVHVKWMKQRETSSETNQQCEAEQSQQSLDGIADTQAPEQGSEPPCGPTAAASDIERQVPTDSVEQSSVSSGDDYDERQCAASEELEIEEASKLGGKRVQHLGTWVMLAMLNALGLYALAERLRAKAERDRAKQGKKHIGPVALRATLDAVAVALSIGKRCVEGVRWLDTPSGPTLLRRVRVISASWCRRVLARFACESALELHWQQGTSLMNSATAGNERAVFYIDNHARPYTGKHATRTVWRMQEKRSRPGVSDFYVHDDAGRALVRIDDPSNGSLTDWLLPTGRLLRTALGGDVKVLQVFDRGGAFPEYMAKLRDDKLEFVTYERAPYRTLRDSAFKHKRWLEFGSKRYRIVEQARKNLGKGRGRVRRIYVQTEERKQLSVLAVSDASAKFLVTKLLARWPCQENQFKHQNERWGINQLDGRRVEAYPPDEVIPNPARRRLDRQLRIARQAEGQARRRLSELDKRRPNKNKKERYEQDLQEARELQRELKALQPELPTHAPVKDTELAGELKRHPGEYKLVIDTLRVALANVESDLAAWLGPELPRPEEAKKHLAKLFDAPGTVRANGKSITIALEPAGTDAVLDAFDPLMSYLNALPLTLPGDPSGRRLRFKLLRK